MRKLLVLLVVAMAAPAFADTTILALPDGATLSFNGPEMDKVKEVTRGNMFQYAATSYGKTDPRFNLTIFVEPKDCPVGNGLKDVATCFVTMNSRNPAIVADSTSTKCTENSCAVSYRTVNEVGTRQIELAHTNTLLVYGDLWVDVHFSITMPTADDAAAATKFSESIVLTPKAK